MKIKFQAPHNFFENANKLYVVFVIQQVLPTVAFSVKTVLINFYLMFNTPCDGVHAPEYPYPAATSHSILIGHTRTNTLKKKLNSVAFSSQANYTD
jgi:hypothetical protein